MILKTTKAADEGVDLFGKVFTACELFYPGEIDGEFVEGSIGLAKMVCLPFAEFQRDPDLLNMLGQVFEAHSATPRALAIR